MQRTRVGGLVLVECSLGLDFRLHVMAAPEVEKKKVSREPKAELN